MRKHEILFRWYSDYEKWFNTEAPQEVFIGSKIVKIDNTQYIKVEWTEED